MSGRLLPNDRYRDRFAIIPKKLRRRRSDAGLTFSSYDTLQNVSLWAQRAEDGLPDLPRLIVGYLFIISGVLLLISYILTGK